MARRRKPGRPKGSKNKRRKPGRPKGSGKKISRKRRKGSLSHLSPGRRKAVLAMWEARGFKKKRGKKAKKYPTAEGFIGPRRKRGPKPKNIHDRLTVLGGRQTLTGIGPHRIAPHRMLVIG